MDAAAVVAPRGGLWRGAVPGVVVGMRAEARIARRLSGAVAIGGGGAAGAARVAEALLDQGVGALISLGLAGGLDPALPAGAVLVPGVIVIDGDAIATDPVLAARLRGGGLVDGRPVFGGTEIAATMAAKRRLWEATGAAAVDLESGAVAWAARARGVPFAALRVVCDPAGRDLPPAARDALTGTGRVAAGRIIASLLRRPGQIGGLLALARDEAAARRALLRQVEAIGPLGVT
ncbi:MAG TPA: hypothetical protein VME92_01530 [Acetobacteraceae bacterium]|nr:hypothetical protein [Acetobacteraceae bacterium]